MGVETGFVRSWRAGVLYAAWDAAPVAVMQCAAGVVSWYWSWWVCWAELLGMVAAVSRGGLTVVCSSLSRLPVRGVV